MVKIQRLTREQEARLAEFRDEWLAIGLATGPADRERAERGLDAAYAAAGLPAPPLKVWLRSPMEGAVGAALLGQVREQVEEQVGERVGQQVREQVEEQVGERVGQQVGQQVEEQVWQQVRQQVGEQVWQQVGRQVREQVEEQVEEQVWQQVEVAGYGQHDANWLAWADYFARVCGLPAVSRLNGLMEVARSAGWFWPFRGAAILTERAVALHGDGQGRLHNPAGLAIEYPDGWGVYAIHGVRVPERVVMQPESLTAKEVATEPNAEVRRVMLDRLGRDRFVAQAQPRVLHEDRDALGHRRRLLRVSLVGDEPVVMLEVTNSTQEPDGSWRNYLLPVPPDAQTAYSERCWKRERPTGVTWDCQAAIAWRHGLLPDEYHPVVET